jgi:hypothetical protein
MCKTRSLLSLYLGNYIHNAFVGGTTKMGGMFIIDVIIVNGKFIETSILMRSRLWENSLNIFFQRLC